MMKIFCKKRRRRSSRNMMVHIPGTDAGDIHDPLIADSAELDHAARQSLLHDEQRTRAKAQEGSFDKQGENYLKQAEATEDLL